MNILFATDGSQGSLAAAGMLARLPLTEDDRILVLTVSESGKDAETILTSAREALRSTAARVEADVRTGPIAETILLTAAEQGSELIAMGAMGRGGLVGYLVGSVTERVMRHSSKPVLVARPVKHELNEVLLAVDRSRISEEVAKMAAWLPLPESAELRLMTVVPPREALVAVAPTVWSGLSQELTQVLEGAASGAEDHLRELGRLLQHTRRTVAAEVRRGEPAHQILEAVDQTGVDLIIMGSHGEGGVDRWLLGSVSERVARHAGCSVLVIH